MRAEITRDLSHKALGESFIFVDLVRGDGSLLYSMELPLTDATFSQHGPKLHETPTVDDFEDLKTTSVRIGVYNHRTKRLLTPRVHEPADAQTYGQSVQLHTFHAPLFGKRITDSP